MTRASLFPLARPILHALDAETAHGLTLALLKRLPPRPPSAPRPRLAVEAMGLSFPNPLGLAAGFDKNADAPDQMLGMGLGFVEIGTVTPLPQPGNPRPRLFRLSEDRAVINRMGFNSGGAAAVAARLQQRGRGGGGGILGLNIGANKEAADRIADYVSGVERFGALADYLTINISSPNTPGLRGLQAAADYDALLARVMAARARLATRPPLLVKIAPDLGEAALDAIAGISLKHAIDGLIVANTTLSRPALKSRHRHEAGGLSGAPLFALSTQVLARMHQRVGGKLTLVGAGGVGDAASALAKIEAGASLIQLYSALVYEGPGLIARILDGLAAACAQRSAGSIAELTGSRAGYWAHQAGNGT